MPKLSDAVRSGKLVGNLQAQECPSRDILKHVTGRWAVLTLIALQGRTIRFAALRRTIGGVSDRMLTQTLQTLEADGFVHRQAFPVVPPHVEYSLTPMGEEVAPDSSSGSSSRTFWIDADLDQLERSWRAAIPRRLKS